jgi:hypothetical protein
MAYGWNLAHFLWKVPSWLLFLAPGEVLILSAYALTGALIESLVILAALALFSFLLPPRFFGNEFIVRAVWLTMIGYGGIMVLLTANASHRDLVGRYWDALSVLIAVLAVLAAYASTRVTWMRRAALWLSDQLTVFLFITIPVSFVSAVVVLFRILV